MHNCKTTRERLAELVLDGSDFPAPLSTELRECAECREEFRALKETLRLTTRLIETATPPDSYWPGYHARLRQKLTLIPNTDLTDRATQSWLTQFFSSSIRVPVPVGLALILVLGLAFIFKIRVPAEPSIVHVPVEVPVIQEKPVERPVERIVYRDREKPSKRPKRVQVPARSESVLATLEGFEPAEEVKLTVIKGGSGNEK